jgi:hypothetical protein
LLAPIGVNSTSSKLCPAHLAHVETAFASLTFRRTG